MKKLLTGFIILLFGCLVGILSGCSTTTDPSETYPGESPEHIYREGKSSLQDKGYNEAIKRFEALDVQYPFDPVTENAQLYLIYAYYMKEEYTMAVAAADRYIRLHPVSPHVDYAYYMRGVANYYQNLGIVERLFAVDLATRDLSQIQQSYNDFSVLTARFPSSPYTPSAHQYMIYLRNVMADHELHIAQFYYNRKAYVAAASRASDLVAHYQGAPTVKPALILMANSYRQLHLTKLEQDTLRVIRYNYH